MVKADVRRDYYADLGLAPSADAEDIKRQFRKLALKFHPDRNPGRELEFNAKFQAIQAAHEILIDPTQRLKYDTDRLRAGYGKFYGPPRTTPARKPPPTSYSPPPTAKQQKKPNFAAGGTPFEQKVRAERYARYARAAPQSWQETQDHGQTRADAFRGFQDMKGSGGMPGWSQFDPRTGQSANQRPAGTAGQSARPKSAYEYFREAQNAARPGSFNAQSTKKKQGFAPNTPGGDEPMASNTSAYTSTSRERTQRSNFFGNVRSPTAKKPTAPEAEAKADKPGTFAERASSRYATTGGEKTFFSSSWLGRSASMRETPPRSRSPRGTTSDANTAHTARHRSVSPKPRRNRKSFSSETSSSDTEGEDKRRPFTPKVPKSRLRAHQKFPGFHAQRDSNSNSTSETGERSSTRHNLGYNNWDYAFNNGKDSDTDRDHVKGHDSDSAAFPTDTQNPFTFAGSGTTSNFTAKPNSSTESHNGAFKSSSHGDLHEKFNAEDWRGAFDDHFVFVSPTPSATDRTRQPQGAGNFWQPTAKSGFSTPSQSGTPSGNSSESADPASTSHQRPTPFTGAKFMADDWVEQFKNMSWALPNDGPQETSRPGSRSPKKQPRPGARARTAPKPATVTTEAEEAKTTLDDSSEQQSTQTGAAGGEAMDIDDDNSKSHTPAPGPDRGAEEQNGNVPKRKPVPPSTKNKAAETKSENSTFNMNKLGKTDPFTNTNSDGIDNLQDIHANLPFESRAKTANPTVNHIRPRDLDCPNPPKRPRPPQLQPISAGSQQLALSRSAWNRYVAEMNTYMREWNDFNGRMLGHFNARQHAVKTGLAPGWISAVGDSARLNLDSQEENEQSTGDADWEDDILVPDTAKGGYSAYLRGLEEDVKVRKHWDVACELHQECILELGQIRKWIRDGGKII